MEVNVFFIRSPTDDGPTNLVEVLFFRFFTGTISISVLLVASSYY